MDTPDVDEIRERRIRVYNLRRERHSVAKIAELLGVSNATVSKDMAWLRSQGYVFGGTDLQVFEAASQRARTSAACDPSRIAELRYKIVEMRLTGMVPRDIARTLGISLQSVQKHLTAVYEAATVPRAEEARQLELDRYDRLLAALEDGIQLGDVKAITAAAKIIGQRVQTQGLLKPLQIEATVLTIDAIDAEIERLVAQLANVTGEQVPMDAEVVEDADV